MSSTKTIALAAGATALGILTLRTLRKRRSADPEPDAGAEARAEVSEATDHAQAAVSHATAAGEHAVKYAREEVRDRSDGTPIAVGDETAETSRRRRIAGRFW